MNNDLKQILTSTLKPDLMDIENALLNNLSPNVELVSKVAGHILFSGGKRIRPLLVVLSARICNAVRKDTPYFSTSVEYLHAATLLHDDLVDEADLRHGKPVANHVWSNSIAVLTGDFLLSRALSIAAKFENLKIIDVFANVTEQMSQGEIFQLIKKKDINITELEYFDIIKRKTAVLFEGACKVGAIIADSSDKEEKEIASYGYNLGIAFQIADDLLDYLSETNILGKTVGADIKEGKLTLPLIYALANANSKDRDIMINIIKNFSDTDYNKLIELLDKYGAINYAKQKALEYITNAKTSLSYFSESKTKETLHNLSDYALLRKG